VDVTVCSDLKVELSVQLCSADKYGFRFGSLSIPTGENAVRLAMQVINFPGTPEYVKAAAL